jgi:hypothetical protein
MTPPGLLVWVNCYGEMCYHPALAGFVNHLKGDPRYASLHSMLKSAVRMARDFPDAEAIS